MEIRLACAKDVCAAYVLMCELEAAKLDETAFRRIYADTISDPMSPCLVAEDEGAVIGFLHLRMEEQLSRCAKIAEIMELVVRSDVRSRGIGARLFEAAVQLARENGCIRLEVASNRVRERAHAFYKKQGMLHTHVKLSMHL